MKKLIASTLAVVVFNIFSPVVPFAHAGIIENQLTQIVGQDTNALRIQQLLAVKKQLEEGNKEQALAMIAQATLQQTAVGGTVEEALRQQVEKKITDQIAPYEKEIAILAALFTNQQLNPNISRENNSLTAAPTKYKQLINMTATAYAPGPLDNGKWDTLTYMGGTVKHGVAAVDPNVIPMGSKLWVEGYGEAIAEDQGSAIKGNRIDLAFNDRNDALDYGIQERKIYVLN